MIETIKNFIKKYNTSLKIWLFCLTFFFMIAAIQIYMNYLMIIENTISIQKQNLKAQEEIDYITNFQMKYLNSEHAMNFLAHENNILSVGETVIDFKSIAQETTDSSTPQVETTTPRKEWKIFFNEKWEKAR